jgi:spore coat protein U-like protein
MIPAVTQRSAFMQTTSVSNFSTQWAITLALMGLPGIGLAASSNATIAVSALVAQNCTISTTAALAFASYDPVGTNATVALNATGKISIACSKGSAGITIGMDNGAHISGTQRQMIGGASANLLQYNIFHPPGSSPDTACTFPGATPWTANGAGLLILTSAPAKTAREYNVCGTIPGGQDVSADSYTDTVGATINF